MKKVAVLMAALLLSACSPSYTEKAFPVRPKELEDCKFYSITNGDGSFITIVRCPNSDTTTQYKSGKTKHESVVIDGCSK